MSAQRNHFELLAGLSEKKAGTPANSAAAKTKNAEKKKKQREKKKAQKIASAPAPPVVMAEEVEYEVVRVDGEVFKFPKSKPSQNTQPVVSVAVEPTEENEQGEGSDGDVDLPPPRVGRSIPITFDEDSVSVKPHSATPSYSHVAKSINPAHLQMSRPPYNAESTRTPSVPSVPPPDDLMPTFTPSIEPPIAIANPLPQPEQPAFDVTQLFRLSISDRLNALDANSAKHEAAISAFASAQQRTEYDVTNLHQVVQVLANENRFLKQQLHALILHLIMSQSAPEPVVRAPIGTPISESRPPVVTQQKTFLKGLLESIVQSNSQPSSHAMVANWGGGPAPMMSSDPQIL